ncbi:hypothetical protein ACK6TK_20115 [Enterobacter hormaechei]|uniref:hypothetical protein n=1 Tax=Enterobacter hormaechei TaxID=158836 RepID=UPI003C2C4D65
MSIISVNAKELGRELAAWGVPHNYAILFLAKSTVKNGRVALSGTGIRDAFAKVWPCDKSR